MAGSENWEGWLVGFQNADTNWNLSIQLEVCICIVGMWTVCVRLCEVQFQRKHLFLKSNLFVWKIRRIGGSRVRWQESDYNLPFLKIVSQCCHAYYRHHSDWLDLRLHLPGTILRFVVSVSMIPIEDHEMILNNWKFSLQTHGQLKNKQDTKTNTKLFCNHLESPEGFKRMTMPCG